MKNWLASWGILILLAFIWGSSFILMKRGLYHEGTKLFSPWQVAALRLSSAFVVLIPVLIKHIRHIFSGLFLPLLVVGWFGNGLPAYLFTLAQTEMASGVVGMLNSLVPLFTFFISISIFKSSWRWAQLFGILIGLFGAIYLISLSAVVLEGNWWYAGFVVIATLCYAISVNTIRHKLAELSSLTIASLGLSLAGIPSFIYLISSSPWIVMSREGSGLGLLAGIALGVVGTAGALILFNGLIKRNGVLFSSSVTYVIPIFAVMWALIDGEQLSWKQALAGAIVLSGVYLVNRAGPMSGKQA